MTKQFYATLKREGRNVIFSNPLIPNEWRGRGTWCQFHVGGYLVGKIESQLYPEVMRGVEDVMLVFLAGRYRERTTHERQSETLAQAKKDFDDTGKLLWSFMMAAVNLAKEQGIYLVATEEGVGRYKTFALTQAS